MVHSSAITFAVAAFLAASPVNAGLYSKSSPVVQIDGKSYDRLIAQSNYTSIVEFYAPWCGHCKNLQPAYEKAAKSLAGLAKVAAIDCDEESNKPFCGTMGVTGFPTLKIVRPGPKPGKPIVEDYQGARTAKGIVEAVTDKIVNHVKRVEDKNLEAWLAAANETAKAVLFTDKGKTSALLKAIAIDFKGGIEVAQVRNTQKATVELFGVTKVPTLILLPGGKEAQGIVYEGELKKEPIVKFLSQAAAPNPDPAPAKAKAPKSKKVPKPKATKAAAEESAEPKAESTEETSEEPAAEKKKEEPIVAPAPPISLIDTEAQLARECLGPKTGTCILAILPKEPNPVVMKTIQSLSEIPYKHFQKSRKIFPFFAVAPTLASTKKLVDALELDPKLDVIAINARRGWWRHLPKAGDALTEADVTEEILTNWAEEIKLGEGSKQKLPEGLVPEEEEAPEEPVAAPVEEPAAVPVEEPVVDTEEPVKAEETEKVEEPVKETHDEL